MSKKQVSDSSSSDKKNLIKIIPLGDRVLVKPKSVEESSKTSQFGIIIPETVDKEKPEQGKVMAVGEGRYDNNGRIVPVNLKVGDNVLFSKYGYDDVKIGDEEYYILKEENILAVIK